MKTPICLVHGKPMVKSTLTSEGVTKNFNVYFCTDCLQEEMTHCKEPKLDSFFKKPFSLRNFSVSEENVWVGNTTLSFYHDQRCPACNYSVPGWNNMNSDGPWDFQCPSCLYEWSVTMLPQSIFIRNKVLSLLEEIDEKVEEIKNLWNNRKS